MPTWAKVILIILAVIVIGVAAVGVVGYRWVKAHANELQADAAKMKTEAAEFARGKDANACVDETLRRLDRCDGIMCELRTKIFLTECARASNVPADFCANIPNHGQIMDTAKWAVAECARRGHQNDQRCTRVITGLQDYCATR